MAGVLLGVYRAKPEILWSYPLVAGYCYLQTYSFDPWMPIEIVAGFASLLFIWYSSGLTLFEDRIEAHSPFGSRVLRRDEIEAVEIIPRKVKSGIVKDYFLRPRDPAAEPILVPAGIKLDSAWFDWMVPVPEEQKDIEKPSATLQWAVTGIFFLAMGLFFVAIFLRAEGSLRTILCSVALLAALAVLWSDRRGELLAGGFLGGSSPLSMATSMILLLAPLYLIFAVTPGTLLVSGTSWPISLFGLVPLVGYLIIVSRSGASLVNIRSDKLLMVTLCALVLGYAGALTINQLADISIPEAFPTYVAQRHYVQGKGGGLYFMLAPWGPETEARRYNPGLTPYNGLEAGNRACVLLHKGALGVPWYQLGDGCMPPKI